MHEKSILEILEMLDFINAHHGFTDYNDYSNLHDAVSLLPCNDWISVADDLPKFTGDVLVGVGINRYGEGMHNEVRVANYNTVSKRFTVYENQSAYIGAITHWMPQPLLPSEV